MFNIKMVSVLFSPWIKVSNTGTIVIWDQILVVLGDPVHIGHLPASGFPGGSNGN